jgi:predicted nucleic acid-binding protein
MTLIDSSAWIEYFRATGSLAHREVRRRIDAGVAIATTDVVVMELLAGARDEDHAHDLKRFLYRFEPQPAHGYSDFERAAELYRRCRREGTTLGSLIDCVVAAIAIREDAEVLHADSDFDAIARHTPLRISRTV